MMFTILNLKQTQVLTFKKDCSNKDTPRIQNKSPDIPLKKKQILTLVFQDSRQNVRLHAHHCYTAP